MPEKDYPSREVGELLTDEEIYQILRRRLDDWNFLEHSEEENVFFAHNTATDVANSFPYLAYASSQEFSGEELPVLLKPIYLTLWSPYNFEKRQHETIECYPTDMRVYLKKRENHDRSPLDAPDEFFEIMRQSKTHNEAVARLSANPELLAAIDLGQFILDEAIYVELEDGYGSTSGLRLLLEPNNVTLTIHGRRGETDELCNFLAINHSKTNLLSELAVQLAVLGAKHCKRPENPQYAHFSLSQYDRSFLDDSGISTERH